VIWVEEQKTSTKIITITITLLICVYVRRLVTPAISKKLDKTTRELPNYNAVSYTSIETYWTQRCTTRVSSIEWSSLEPGASEIITLFIKNKEKA
jgi:hypothetical protein